MDAPAFARTLSGAHGVHGLAVLYSACGCDHSSAGSLALMDSADWFPISSMGSRPQRVSGLTGPWCVQLCHHALLQLRATVRQRDQAVAPSRR